MQKHGADACWLKLEGKERQKRFGEGDEALRLFAAGEVKLPEAVLTKSSST
tara:strand:+ start:1519 stop:1671 length:153 start_codon:yes stop_codon:yes gene_type:complete